jgi:hypothetical protein
MSRKDKPYMPLYIQDFLTDEKLMECSASATGVYIRIMCIMHKSETYGTILLKQKDKQKDKQIENFALKLAKHLPYDLATVLTGLEELIGEGCLYIDNDFLVQKRMFNDGNLSETRSFTGHLGGVATQEKVKNFALANIKANTDIDIDIENDNESSVSIVGILKKPKRLSGVKKIKPEKVIKDPFEGKLIKWIDWKIYKKKEKGFSYRTELSENQALSHLFEISNGDVGVAENIINQSIRNSWQGLFPLKNNNNGQTESNANAVGKTIEFDRP